MEVCYTTAQTITNNVNNQLIRPTARLSIAPRTKRSWQPLGLSPGLSKDTPESGIGVCCPSDPHRLPSITSRPPGLSNRVTATPSIHGSENILQEVLTATSLSPSRAAGIASFRAGGRGAAPQPNPSVPHLRAHLSPTDPGGWAALPPLPPPGAEQPLRPLEDPSEAAAEQEAELLREEDPGDLRERALCLAAQVQQRGPQKGDAEAEAEEDAPIGEGGLQVPPEPGRYPLVPPHPGRRRGAARGDAAPAPPGPAASPAPPPPRSPLLLPGLWLRSPPAADSASGTGDRRRLPGTGGAFLRRAVRYGTHGAHPEPPETSAHPRGGREPSEPPPPASPPGGVEQHRTQREVGSSHCAVRASLLRLHPTQQKTEQPPKPSLCCLSSVPVNKDNRSRQMQLKVSEPLLWIGRAVRWAVGVCAFWSWSG